MIEKNNPTYQHQRRLVSGIVRFPDRPGIQYFSNSSKQQFDTSTSAWIGFELLNFLLDLHLDNPTIQKCNMSIIPRRSWLVFALMTFLVDLKPKKSKNQQWIIEQNNVYVFDVLNKLRGNLLQCFKKRVKKLLWKNALWVNSIICHWLTKSSSSCLTCILANPLWHTWTDRQTSAG